jgi:transposase
MTAVALASSCTRVLAHPVTGQSRFRRRAYLSKRPKRWIVELTFGWLSRYRRMSKDYERKVQTSETLIEVTMIRLLVARLGR